MARNAFVSSNKRGLCNSFHSAAEQREQAVRYIVAVEYISKEEVAMRVWSEKRKMKYSIEIHSM